MRGQRGVQQQQQQHQQLMRRRKRARRTCMELERRHTKRSGATREGAEGEGNCPGGAADEGVQYNVDKIFLTNKYKREYDKACLMSQK